MILEVAVGVVLAVIFLWVLHAIMIAAGPDAVSNLVTAFLWLLIIAMAVIVLFFGWLFIND